MSHLVSRAVESSFASSRRARVIVIVEEPTEPLTTANPLAALDRLRAGDEFVD